MNVKKACKNKEIAINILCLGGSFKKLCLRVWYENLKIKVILRDVKGAVERKRILGTNETAVHVEARVQKDVDRIQFVVPQKFLKQRLRHADAVRPSVRPSVHTTFTANTFQHVFMFITQNCYTFQPYDIVGIFRQSQVWSTCTAYLVTCHR
jgi:hypothetical protein